MAYLKDRYSFDEVVTRLSEHDSSINCTDDIVDLVKSGKLEVLLELNDVKLLPMSEGFKSYNFLNSVTNRKKMFQAEKAFGESIYADFLRVYVRWVKSLKSNNELSIYKPVVKGETLKNLTLMLDVLFAPLSIFHNSRNQLSSISEDWGWRDFLKNRKANSNYLGLYVDTPILVSPFIFKTADCIHSYIEGFPNYSKEHQFIKCHTLGEDWLIVKSYEEDIPWRLVSDDNAVIDAVKDGKVYILGDSIQSFEKKYLGINHSVNDLSAKQGKHDKQKPVPIQERREAAFKEWLEVKGDIEAVRRMTKKEVWEILQRSFPELFNANRDYFFRVQKKIKFDLGRRPK